MPIDTPPFNPFLRGFNDLRIQRLLAILYDAQAPLCYLLPHPSQQHWNDAQLERHPCLFNDHHGLIMTTPAELAAHEETYPHQGIVMQVIYGVFAHDQAPPIMIGDLYSQTLAQQRVEQLAFETGHYSRCWEVSSAHLPHNAWDTLQALIWDGPPSGLRAELFALPDSHALGFKLMATPWTDQHLMHINDGTIEQLRQQQLDAGLPAELVDVLHLAAQADVRILIFDPDAACLDGLPLYDSHQ